jgi:hypothetical protein
MYSMSTVEPSPLRSRSRDRPEQQTHYDRNRRDRQYEYPNKMVECSACGKCHPGGNRECQFIQHKHPDANRLQIP